MDVTLWQSHYDTGVRPTLRPYPNKTLIDVVNESARARPKHPALWFKGAVVSYAELDRLSDVFAAGLIKLGVKKGDRVAILMPNCPQYVIAELGIWKAGGIVASVNPLYTGTELEHMLKECGAETIVTLSLFYNKIKEVQAKTPARRVIVGNIKDYLPTVKRVLFTLVKEKKDGHRVTLRAGDFWFNDVLSQNQGGRANVAIDPADQALILFTGGTTGLAKAAVGTHAGLIKSGLQISEWFKSVLNEWDEMFLTSLPLFHVFAAAGIQPVTFIMRGTMALVPNPRDIEDVVETIQETKATFVPGVPTFFNALLNNEAVKSGKADLSSIKLNISGASALLESTKVAFETLTDSRIVEGYALTESMMACVITPVHGAYKVGSVGMPVSDVVVRIVDLEDSARELPTGEDGEIAIQADQLMLGYWNRPDATQEILRDGWLYTGDIGHLDEDGYLFIVDRKKDVIKPSGFQVWPREVEEVIAKHPAVAEVGVAGVPDERTSEAVKAWVVLKEGKIVTTDDIKNFCRESLAAYKVPKYVEFRTSLPKSAVGKILRRELTKES